MWSKDLHFKLFIVHFNNKSQCRLRMLHDVLPMVLHKHWSPTMCNHINTWNIDSKNDHSLNIFAALKNVHWQRISRSSFSENRIITIAIIWILRFLTLECLIYFTSGLRKSRNACKVFIYACLCTVRYQYI